ncbi:MAG: hypothetical protein Q8877_03220, partial [Sweet potato little leaf phytoplasma]|nr:hypothetical protein [Sweet potato little leaf phytoplasma]
MTIAGGLAGDLRRYVVEVHDIPRQERTRQSNTPLCFDNSDFQNILRDHDDPMVITEGVGNYIIQRMLVDQGSSADVIFEPVLAALGLKKVRSVPRARTLDQFCGG